MVYFWFEFSWNQKVKAIMISPYLSYAKNISIIWQPWRARYWLVYFFGDQVQVEVPDKADLIYKHGEQTRCAKGPSQLGN